jgi:hypothetical protein
MDCCAGLARRAVGLEDALPFAPSGRMAASPHLIEAALQISSFANDGFANRSSI